MDLIYTLVLELPTSFAYVIEIRMVGVYPLRMIIIEHSTQWHEGLTKMGHFNGNCQSYLWVSYRWRDDNGDCTVTQIWESVGICAHRLISQYLPEIHRKREFSKKWGRNCVYTRTRSRNSSWYSGQYCKLISSEVPGTYGRLANSDGCGFETVVTSIEKVGSTIHEYKQRIERVLRHTSITFR